MSAPTRAVAALARAKVAYGLHPYQHLDSTTDFGNEVVAALGVDPAQVFKTLVVSLDSRLVVGIVPMTGTLDLKSLAAALGGKKAVMARPDEAERATGYVVGGISPLGQRRTLPTVIDSTARDCDVIYLSAGKRGLQMSVAAADIARLTGARFADIAG